MASDQLEYSNIPEEEKNSFFIRKGDLLFNRTFSKELVGKTGVFTTSSKNRILKGAIPE